MSKKDWTLIGAIATIGGTLVTAHGITSKRWETWHTMLVVAAAVATVGPDPAKR